MRCTVLLFAGLADAAGTRQMTIELTAGARVVDLIEIMCREHASLRAMRDRVAVAVNERYVDANTALAEDDVIALIPPVSGG
jgi:molybdopterin synthase catalytic subunit